MKGKKEPTMTKKSGGTKRSSWLTLHRRLILVRILLQKATSKQELIQRVQAEMGEQGYPEATESALKHDLDALKTFYGCVIKFQRRSGKFVLKTAGVLALLDLSDYGMEALSLLNTRFRPEGDFPEYSNIRALLEHIALLLPEHQQEQFYAVNNSFQHPLSEEHTKPINAQVSAKIKRAINQKKLIEFDYESSFDGIKTRRHRVAPYGIVFEPEEQSYLDATLIHVSPAGNEVPQSTLCYRINRIVKNSVTILPESCPDIRPEPVSHTLRYVLSPEAAQRTDVAAYFPNTKVKHHNDGRATITATTTNLWQAQQILLRYGIACEVQEPPELVAMFRDMAQKFSSIYQ